MKTYEIIIEILSNNSVLLDHQTINLNKKKNPKFILFWYISCKILSNYNVKHFNKKYTKYIAETTSRAYSIVLYNDCTILKELKAVVGVSYIFYQ
jgi:hypothetical protein